LRLPANVEHINGRAADTELADHRLNVRLNVGTAEMFQHSTRERADRLQIWPLLSSGQELGTENGRNNEFMTVFSHELRNSLGAIRSAACILRMDTSAGSPAAKARVLIERQVGQMTRLVEDLLDVSRVRSGQLRLQCERVDLRAVAAHAAQTVDFTMQQRSHRMTTSFPDAPVWLQADPARLEQVFVNLLLNAAKNTDSWAILGWQWNGKRAKPSCAFATPASALILMSCRTCSISSSRRIRHRGARTRASVSDSPWCAVWSSAKAATSP
jgi:signal transduction histidine kinase